MKPVSWSEVVSVEYFGPRARLLMIICRLSFVARSYERKPRAVTLEGISGVPPSSVGIYPVREKLMSSTILPFRTIAIIGREEEVARLDQSLLEARSGAGSIVIVRGPTGIGKTRLLEHARSRALMNRFHVALGHNYETVRAPLGPFEDIVKQLRPVSRGFVPEMPANRKLFERFFGTETTEGDPNVDRRKLFVVLADALTNASSGNPIALILDDSQWLDPESIEFLRFFASRIGTLYLVIFLGCSEDVGSQGTEELNQHFHAINRSQTMIVRELSVQSSRELIAVSIPAGALPPRTVDDICRLGDGNPFLLTELVHEAISNNGKVSLPTNLKQAAKKRIRALIPPHSTIVEIAASLGRSFTFDDLITIADRKSTTVLESIRQASDAGIIIEHPWIEDNYIFRNELLRAAAYESMLHSQRRQIHTKIANMYELRGAAPEILADHWRRAGNRSVAATYAARSAEVALELGAYASARDRLLDILEDRVSDEARALVFEKLANACGALGDTRAAKHYIEEAMTYYRAVGATAKLLQLECQYADIAYRCGNTTDAIAAAERVLSSQLASAELRFIATESLATFYAFQPNVTLANHYLALADSQHNGRTLKHEVRLEWARATIAMETSMSDSWFEPAAKSLHMAERLGQPRILAYTSMNFAAMAREGGRSDLARPALEKAIKIADENGLVLAAAYARCEAIAEAYSNGRLLDALTIIRDVISMQVDATINRIEFTAAALPVLADIGITNSFPHLFDFDLLGEALNSGEQSRFGVLGGALTYAEALTGNTDNAVAIIEEILPKLSSSRHLGFSLLIFARFGNRQHLNYVQQLLQSDRHRSNEVYYHFVNVLYARAAGQNIKEINELAYLAKKLALANNNQLLVAFGLELVGQKQEASQLYAKLSANFHVTRLGAKSLSLTKREQEVSKLIELGFTNRKIAESLILSERTVENHVASIFMKLGIKNRTAFLLSKRLAVSSK